MKKILFLCLFAFCLKANAQTHINQNGLQTSVIGNVAASDAGAKRYLVAELGYNSFHWQYGGAVVIELYSPFYSTGYQKFVVECSYARGTSGSSPKVSMLEGYGVYQSGKVTLGTPVNLGTSTSGYDNFKLPIYVDVRYYAQFKVKITYMQNRVNELDNPYQIKIYESPTEMAIDDFVVPQVDQNFVTLGSLLVDGSGNSHIMGNVGIGTKTPQEKLSVNGKIRAKEIKVEATGWPDYVFQPHYDLMPLGQVETFIKANGHLPGVPSAQKAEQEGVELGEMNKVLLKKIEELTLHLIELKKEVEQLRRERN